MASSAATAAVIGSLFAVLFIVSPAPAAAARPCKTLLISYSFSIERKPIPNHPNPNLDIPSSRFLVFTSRSTYFNPRPSVLTFELDDSRLPLPPRHRHVYHGVPQRIARTEADNDNHLGWFDIRSFRDRAVDILSVVLALLFGVGCGALTAATMFLVWSFCLNNRGEGFEEDEEDLSSIKKMGYVKITEDEKVPEPIKA
ncbi:hypothetical protein MLD38_001164 [Melastoma candidum]|uniref:Uncharacterized protein n=1 Tax=Melastoma candidum TaxID=119954 RepID=A0ACB9SCG5_9MYRT|nr:hypothetical protein MLD38_001164 [Melastoma candidum]